MSNDTPPNSDDLDLVDVEIDDLLYFECEEKLTPFYIEQRSFFEKEIGQRLRNEAAAVEFYKTLDYESFKKRESMIFWENAVASIFYDLIYELSNRASRSINIADLAKKELAHTENLLNTGINRTLFDVGQNLIEKIR